VVVAEEIHVKWLNIVAVLYDGSDSKKNPSPSSNAVAMKAL
jgi:hypothetical protein